MSWLRDWLIDTLEVDVPAPVAKYAIILFGSIAGGCLYAQTGSWLAAIRWDLFVMFVVWVAAKVAELVGQYIVKAILFILP
jgi:hypothetical protein